MPTFSDLQNLSRDVYNQQTSNPNYTAIAISANSSVSADGFHAILYHNSNDNSYVIAYRGTSDINALKADGQMLQGLVPSAFVDGYNFYNSVKDYLQQNDSSASLSITGQSFGGSIVQYVSSRTGVDGVAFNPYGTKSILDSISGSLNSSLDFSHITNYLVNGDPIANASAQPGTTYHADYTPQLNAQDIALAEVPDVGEMLFAGDYALKLHNDILDSNKLQQSNFTPVDSPLDQAYRSGFSFLRNTTKAGADAGSNLLAALGQLGNKLQFNLPGVLPLLPTPGFGPLPGLLLGPLLGAPQSPFQFDPLVVDLTGNGFQTTTVKGGVYFNFQNNGFAQHTAWIGSNDGILARDMNGDGIIDNGSELFGNQTAVQNGQTASNGFAALAGMDSNGDGVINSSDTNFSQLGILKSDGTFESLAQAGIQSISLNNSATNVTDAQGNTQVSLGTFTKTNNTSGQIADYNFLATPMDTIALNQVPISSSIAALPNLQGLGVVNSLQQAMGLDTSGTLQSLVQSFISQTDFVQQSTTMDEILQQWSGAQTPSSTYHIASGKEYINPEHIAILEQFMGQSYNNDPNSPIYLVPASMLSQAYYQLKNYYAAQLMVQTQLSTYFSNIQATLDTTNNKYIYNLNTVISAIEQLASTNPSQARHDAAAFAQALTGLNMTSSANYTDFYTSISGLGADYKAALDQAGYTVVSATGANQTIGYSYWQREPQDAPATWLVGGQGNDDLQGGYNNDVLQGGPGDTLEGGYGNDTYLYSTGGGHEQIIEGGNYYYINNASGGNDTIKFGPGITQTNISNANLIRTNKIIQMYYSLNSFRKAA